MIFFPQGDVSGVHAPNVNLGPLISRFLFVDYFASNFFNVLHSCIPLPRLFSRSWVKVKRRSKLCEGQPLCHSALRCCQTSCGLLWWAKLIISHSNYTFFILTHFRTVGPTPTKTVLHSACDICERTPLTPDSHKSTTNNL